MKTSEISRPFWARIKIDTAFAAVLVLLFYGSVQYGRTFLSFSNNLSNVLRTASLMGIMAIGVNLCFLIGSQRFIGQCDRGSDQHDHCVFLQAGAGSWNFDRHPVRRIGGSG